MEVLCQIGSRDHGHEVALRVDNWELSLLGLGKNGISLEQGSSSRSSDEIGNHNGRNWLAEVLLELDVSICNNADEFGSELASLYFGLVKREKDNSRTIDGIATFVIKSIDLFPTTLRSIRMNESYMSL